MTAVWEVQGWLFRSHHTTPNKHTHTHTHTRTLTRLHTPRKFDTGKNGSGCTVYGTVRCGTAARQRRLTLRIHLPIYEYQSTYLVVYVGTVPSTRKLLTVQQMGGLTVDWTGKYQSLMPRKSEQKDPT